MLCIDRTGEALKKMGVTKPEKSLKKAHRWAADSLMIKIALFVLLGFAIVIVGANLLMGMAGFNSVSVDGERPYNKTFEPISGTRCSTSGSILR